MNPFDLSGPPFLAFYVVVAIFVAVAAKLFIDAGEGGVPPSLPLGDPYQIAWLRGGTPEAARIAVLALIDRGLLAVNGDNLVNSGSGQSFVRADRAGHTVALHSVRDSGDCRPRRSSGRARLRVL